MPTVIDSLIVKLGFDTAEFNRGAKAVDSKSKQTTANLAKLLAVFGGVAAIKTFVTHTIESSAALDRLAKNLGIATDGISSFSLAAEQAGGTAEGMQSAIDMLSRAQTELALTGQSSLIPYFAALGVSMTDAAGKAQSPLDQLAELSDRFERMDRTTAFNMGRSMGFDAGTMNLLLKGRKEVELIVARQKEQNAVTKKQGEEASRLRESLVKSKQSFEAFGREMLSKATPAIESVLKALEKFGDWARENETFVTAFLGTLAAALVAVGVATTPINLTAMAVVALAAAFAGLYDDYQTWAKGGNSLFDWSGFESGINKSKVALGWLKDAISDVVYRAAAGGDVVWSFLTGDWKRLEFAKNEFKNGIGKQYGKSETPTALAIPKTVPTPTTDRQKFIAEASRQLGVPANVIDAQLRLETGATGKSTIGEFNYGNMKAGSGWSGSTVSRNVGEYDKAGKAYTENAKFKSYATPEQAAADYAAYIKRKYPDAAKAQTPMEYATALYKGGYATDPDYVSKIAKIGAGIPGASAMGAGNLAMQSGKQVVNNIETKIGEIKVVTQATDAAGIAKSIGKETDFLFTSQANFGVN